MEEAELMKHHIGYFNRYLKEYTFSVRETISQRNFLSQEYYQHKLTLNEKKAKTMQTEPRMQADPTLLELNNFDSEQALSNEEIYKRVIYSNVE